MDASFLYSVGAILIIIGVAVVILAVILLSMGKSEKGNVKSAGVIMIGPIPIIFGNDKKAIETVVVLAVALVIVLILYYLLVR